MLGVIVNAVAIVIGTVIGLIFKKLIPQKLSDAVIKSLGLCIIVVGIDGVLKGTNQLILIISMVLGTILGELIDIDNLISKLSNKILNRFDKEGNNTVSKAFISASLLFCIGSMTITGSLNAGLTHDYSILFTKSALDFVSACMLATTLGFGVMISSIPIILIQGSIVMVSSLIEPILTTSGNDIICCGSVLIIAIGLNLMSITKIKVANQLPAIIFVPIVYYIFTLF